MSWGCRWNKEGRITRWWHRNRKRDVIALRHDQWKLSHARPGDAVPVTDETMKGLNKMLANAALGPSGIPFQGLGGGLFQSPSIQSYCPYCRRHR